MSDGLEPPTGIIAAILGALLGRPRPKLKVILVGVRNANKTLTVWAKVTNEADISMTVDTVSLHVRADRGRRGIESVEFKSGPKLPFRLDGYSSAEWRTVIKIREQWMFAHDVDCTVFVAGGGISAWRRRKIVQS